MPNQPFHLHSSLMIRSMEMASNPRFTYQRLRNEGAFAEEQILHQVKLANRTRSWSRFINRRGVFRRRLKIRIPGIRRLIRKKNKLLSAVRLSCNKVIKRFVEGRLHMGDLFAGNYLFMQVAPTSFKCHEKLYMGHNLPGFPSKYSLPKIA